MEGVAANLDQHRVAAANLDSVCVGTVRYGPVKSAWFLGMLTGALVGGAITFTWSAFAASLVATAAVPDRSPPSTRVARLRAATP